MRPSSPRPRPLTVRLALIALAALAAPPLLADDAAAQATARPSAEGEAPPAAGTEASPSCGVEQSPVGQPRYLEAMRRELTGMQIEGVECAATDAQRGQCTFTARGASTSREFRVHAIYSDGTDTVYLYVERYLSVPETGATTPAVLRRLMELNWSLLLGKLEWDSTEGEVRLAMVLNTDSNFDRRAFRSAVRGLSQLADRYWVELDRLVRGDGTAR